MILAIDAFGWQTVAVLVALVIALFVAGLLLSTKGDDDGTWGEGRTAPPPPPKDD